MAKVTGFKCDVCNNVENGNDRPFNWHSLRLPMPNIDHPGDNTKDICSDKCLLVFAKERNGLSPRTSGKTVNKDEATPLNSFLTKNGVAAKSRPGIIGSHHKGRHEATGGRENCLVCQFLTSSDA